MLNAVETIKAMGGEQGAVDRYCNLFVDLLNNQLAQGRLEVLFQALTSVLRLGAPLVIFTLGALEVLGGRMSVGTMLAVNTFAIGIFDPLSRLVEKVEQFERLGLHLDRMRDIHESPREQAPGKLPLHEPLSGAVALEKVSFRHGPLERDVIRDVSVTIRAGEFIGIVGASGAGKSTLAGLLLGLYKPTEGRVVYDGRSLHELDLTSLRAQLGVVTQATQLFAGTIRSNIALSNPELSQTEVERAAQLAHIHEDIVRMPAGYDTVLASSGSSLSGGQRQRVALARALARRPALLLLDEATSALDSVSESAIQAALEKVRCTRVVIAHRLSTVAHADRILVVEAGRIVEDGAPHELLARGGAYARLVAQQMGGGWPPSAAEKPQQPQPVQHAPAAQVEVAVPAQPRVIVPPAPLRPGPTERRPSRPAVPAHAQHASAPHPTQKLMMATQQGHAGVPEQIIHEIASRRAAGAYVDERRSQRPAPSRKPAEPVSVMMCRVVGSPEGQEA
jgi:ABC-type bacteriocin/lantibiotic exporter with double-glycine peptidase domain